MNHDAWLTLGVILIAFVALSRDRYPASVVLLGAVVSLLLLGVITPDEAFRGFSNPAPITVAALYVVAKGVEKTGLLGPVVSTVLGAGSRGHRRFLARLVLPTAAMSAFLNNTPIVALTAPQVTQWAREYNHSPSRYLMPLSFAAILGGVTTLIGTSTNLVLSGLLQESGRPPLGMFEITHIGLPAAIVGLAMIPLLAPWLVPERKGAVREAEEQVTEFVVGLEVAAGSQLEGSTIESAGLRNLKGVYLMEVVRNGSSTSPVDPSFELKGGDRLTFVGRADQILDLQGLDGLVSSEHEHLVDFNSPDHAFFEVVIGPGSPLVGRSLKEAGFRSRYQAAVVAIHRAGHRIAAKLGSVKFRVGDTAIVLSDRDFDSRWADRRDFLLITPLRPSSRGKLSRQAWTALSVAGLVIVGAGSGVLPILHASLAGAIMVVLFGVLRPGEARAAVDMDVIVAIASALGLAAAVQVSGIAALIGGVVAGTLGSMGPGVALLGLLVFTVLILTVITNNAAAALMFPIAVSTAMALGADVRTFVIALAVASSASFLTPISYQTNLMVYGPGGYRFWDYARLGGPLVVMMLGAIVLLSRV